MEINEINKIDSNEIAIKTIVKIANRMFVGAKQNPGS